MTQLRPNFENWPYNYAQEKSSTPRKINAAVITADIISGHVPVSVYLYGMVLVLSVRYDIDFITMRVNSIWQRPGERKLLRKTHFFTVPKPIDVPRDVIHPILNKCIDDMLETTLKAVNVAKEIIQLILNDLPEKRSDQPVSSLEKSLNIIVFETKLCLVIINPDTQHILSS